MTRLFAAFLFLLFALPASAATTDEARAAFRYSYPVYQMMVTRTNAVTRVEGAGGKVVNAINHRPTLSDHTNRTVTTPNNDTLYSASWLDLSNGGVVLNVPETGSRYASAALMDLFTDHFALLGTRTTKGRPGRYFVVGPDWRGSAPAGTKLIRSPMNDAWLIVRVLVDGPEDLAAARQVQTQFTITPSSPQRRPFVEPIGAVSDPKRFLAVVNEALGRSPASSSQVRRARAFRSVGIVPGDTQAWKKLDSATQALWRANIQRFYDELLGGLQDIGAQVNGWSYPAPGMGNFATKDLYRAQVALGGLGALPPEEAIYLSNRTDAAGAPLEGTKSYRLTIPAGVPVDAFWSLSLYEIALDGRLFFVSNPIRRYAVGNRTAGLERNADGSLTLTLQSQPPTNGVANWLPTPAGPFALTFRGYIPRKPLLTGQFRLPAVNRLTP